MYGALQVFMFFYVRFPLTGGAANGKI